MTTLRMNATPSDPARDADRIGDAWDALVADRQPSLDGPEAELLAIVGQLSAEATQVRPTLTFRNHLRETLMHTPPLTAALPAPAFHPLPKLGRPVEVGYGAERPVTTIPSRIQRTGMRWAAVAATIALLLVTAAGGFLVSRGPGESGPTRIPGFQFASPEASPETGTYVDPCAKFRPYFPCTGPGPWVSVGIIDGSLYADEVTDGATEVEMQSWSIAPNKSVSFPPSDIPVTAVGMDIVIEGAYAATFSGPVTVARSGPVGTGFEYPAAGTRVELSKGDAVSYEFATRAEIINPLQTQSLEFKSIVFGRPAAELDLAGVQSIDGDPTIVVDGKGVLPQPLSAYPNRDVTIYLTYSQIDPTAPFPPKLNRGWVVLGPVDPIQPGVEEGYILWAFEPAG